MKSLGSTQLPFSSANSNTFQHLSERDGGIHLPNGHDVLRAEFVRAGPDLIVVSPDGTQFIAPGYFMEAAPPDFISEGGAILSANLVGKLAGPVVLGSAQSAPIPTTVVTSESIGSVTALDGTVKVTHADGTQITLSQGDPIYQGDVIETGAASSIGIVFADNAVFSLDADGRMVMDEMVYDPNTQTGTFNTTVVQGVFSFVSGQVAKTSPEGMVVNTPNATIGIRGSTVLGQAAEGSANKVTLIPDVDGYVGEIIVSNAAGTLVLNQAGATTTVFNPSAPPAPVTIWNNADIQKSYGGTLTSLVKAIANKAEADASADAQRAEQATKKAEAVSQDAEAATQQAQQAESDAKTTTDEAEVAKDEAAKAEAEAQAAKLAAEVAKVEAQKLASEEAKAKALAAEIKAQETAAAAKAKAEAAAQAEAQAKQAQAESLKAQAEAQTKQAAAEQAKTLAGEAMNKAAATAQFKSLATSALQAQSKSQYIMLDSSKASEARAATAAKADTSSKSTTVSTANTDTKTTSSDTASTDTAAKNGTTADAAQTTATDTPQTTATETTTTSTTSLASALNVVDQVTQAASTPTVVTTSLDTTQTTTTTSYTLANNTTTNSTTTGNTVTTNTTTTTTTSTTTSGKAIDGYISGATVFIDANSNGTLDSGETSTTTDASGNFTLTSSQTGPLVMTGGTDISTGKAFIGTMTAPSGSTVVTPLTTMISSMMSANGLSASAAQAKLSSVLGLDTTVDLSKFDPVANATSTDTATAAKAANIMKAAVQIQNTIVQAASVLQGASGTMTDAQATANVFAAMAAKLNAEGAGSTFLTDAAKMTSIITTAAQNGGISGAALTNVNNAAGTVAGLINANNGKIQALTGSGGDLLTGLTQTALVAQGDAVAAIKAAIGNSGALTTLNTDYVTNIDAKIQATTNLVKDVGVGTAYRAGDDTLVGTADNDTINGFGGNDIISGLAGDDILLGGTGNDTLNGNAGNDRLVGGTGTNALAGGIGNDTYVLDNASDTITENVGEGTDAVHVVANYTLGANIENLTLTGTGNVNGTGNTLDNTIIGNTGNNILDGGAGADTLTGGAGNDIYVVDNAGDVVTEASDSGSDTVQSSITYTLSNNVETLQLTGSANIDATGSANADTLIGNTGNNILDGGAGADTLTGGAGDDTYIVDNAGDTVIEGANGGTDTIQASISSTIAANVETLQLTGSANINATGSANADTLTGNTGNNILDGDAGADTLTGGTGDDTYVVDNAGDVVTEASDSGSDTVQSSITYTLSNNVETLILTGSANIDATGNTISNILTGNSGNNILDGGAGADTLTGGAGDDTYVVDNAGDTVIEGTNGGTDTIQASVSFTIAANVETLQLTGSANIDATGSANADTLIGNTGSNILDGGAGADTLTGGTGDDIYIVDNAGDVVIELANGGVDEVDSSITYTLTATVEDLWLTGSNSIDGTGNALNNFIWGNNGHNVIDGGAGDDDLDGDYGDDLLIGGLGNDTFGDELGRNIFAGVTGEDSATFASDWSAYRVFYDGATGAALVANGAGMVDMMSGVGSLTFTNGTYLTNNATSQDVKIGTTGADTLTAIAAGSRIHGHTGNDSLTGGAGTDVLVGGSGDDTLNGTGGADILVGGFGNDTLVGGTGNSTLVGGLGTDTVNYTTVNSIAVGTVAGEFTVVHANGTDTLYGIENVLVNGIASDASASAPTGNSTNTASGNIAGAYALNAGSLSTAGTLTTVSAQDLTLGAKAALFTADAISIGGGGVNYGGILSGNASIGISVAYTNAASGIVMVEQDSGRVGDSLNINIQGTGNLTNYGILAASQDLDLKDGATLTNFGLAMGYENRIVVAPNATINNHGVIDNGDSMQDTNAGAFTMTGGTLNNWGIINISDNAFKASGTASVVNYGLLNVMGLDYYGYSSLLINGDGLTNYGTISTYEDIEMWGASVNANYGDISVNNGRFQVEGTASLFNAGRIVTSYHDIRVINNGSLLNTGLMITGAEDFYFVGNAHVVNAGTMIAGEEDMILASNNEGSVAFFHNTADGLVQLDESFIVEIDSTALNDGAMFMRGTDITINDTAFDTYGHVINTGTITVFWGGMAVYGTVTNSGAITVAESDATIDASGTFKNLSDGTFTVGGTLYLNGNLVNDGAVTAMAYTNNGNYSGSGTLTVNGALDVYGALTTNVTGTVTASIATLASLTNSGSVYMEYGLTVNGAVVNDGVINTGSTTYMYSNVTNNANGTIIIGGTSTSDLSISGNFINYGILSCADDMTVGGNFDNYGTSVLEDDCTATGTLTNHAGALMSGDSIWYGGATAHLVNYGTINQNWSVTVHNMTTYAGSNFSTEDILYIYGALVNAGNIAATYTITMDSTNAGTITNAATGVISTAYNLNAGSSTVNNDGVIASDGSVYVNTLNNGSTGMISTAAYLYVYGAADNGAGGKLAADNSMYFSQNFTNAGTVVLGDGMVVGATGQAWDLTNSGSITMENDLTVYDALVNNSGGAISIGGLMIVSGGITNAGTIAVSEAHAMTGTYTSVLGTGAAGSLAAGGELTLGGDLVIDSSGVTPVANDAFQILKFTSSTGTLGTITGLDLSTTLVFTAALNATDLTLTTTTATVSGTTGIDALNGTAGADVISAGAGADSIVGSAGNDFIYGGAGVDLIDYSAASSAITVNLGNGLAQAVGGGMGSDLLNGIESVLGSNFNDTITLNTSGGTAMGNGGADSLTASAGADIFRYTATTESGVGTGDTITGFNALNADIINLSGLQTGTWNGTVASFTGAAATFAANGNTQIAFNDTTKLLQVDADGNSVADMDITLAAVSAINIDSADFSFV